MGRKRAERLVIAEEAMEIDDEESTTATRIGHGGSRQRRGRGVGVAGEERLSGGGAGIGAEP